MKPIRVVVVDDYGLVRDGLRLLLDEADDIEVAGAACSIEEALDAVGAEAPNVILLDLVMGGVVTLKAIPRLQKAAPEAGILVLSAIDDPHYARDAFAAGARGYLLKEAVPAKLLEAVRDVAVGNHYLDPEAGARLALACHEAGEDSEDGLADREREVLRLLALGYTSADIAPMVRRSPRTIELYRSRIMDKLGLRRRVDLVRYALDHGLLDDGFGSTPTLTS